MLIVVGKLHIPKFVQRTQGPYIRDLLSFQGKWYLPNIYIYIYIYIYIEREREREREREIEREIM